VESLLATRKNEDWLPVTLKAKTKVKKSKNKKKPKICTKKTSNGRKTSTGSKRKKRGSKIQNWPLHDRHHKRSKSAETNEQVCFLFDFL
jgi:hypothetical protein